MAMREALAIAGVAAAAGSTLAEMPGSSEAQALHQPTALEQTYQAPIMTFEQFAGSQPVAVAADAAPRFQTSMTIMVRGASESVEDVASKRVIFGEDEHIKPDKAGETHCMWTRPGEEWTNSVRLANGRIYYYNEDTPAELCRDKNSPTGWVKVAGGATGRDCHNAARPHAMKNAPENVEVINLRKLNVSFVLKAVAKASAGVVCEGASASGSAEAVVKQKFNLKQFLRMRGSGEIHTGLKIVDKAVTKAKASAHCESITTTTTTTPPTTPPTPSHACEVASLTEKSDPAPGRTVDIYINGDPNPTTETIDWGDGATQGSHDSTVSHTYNSDGSWNVKVHEAFADGGTADCSTTAVTQLEQAPPAPSPSA